MSKIALTPNASGTGTFTIASPDSNTNRTLTLPDVSGEVFSQGNILGTVTESSGVPTGAIIERGSNANGEFVKYADGTMICRSGANPTTLGAYTAAGNIFRTDFVTLTYPVAFASGTPVDGSYAINVTTAFVGGGGFSTTSGQTRGYAHNARAAGDTVTFIAIGRWF